MAELLVPHGPLSLPTFLPDATVGVVRATDATDVRACGIDAVVMNTFHLMQRPGTTTIQALGGLHQMSGWDGPIITDSGGFQAYSLIRQQPKRGTLSDQGIVYTPEGSDRSFQLTPEKTVQLQLRYGADIVICLDDCTHVDDDRATQERAVRRTIAWARRCKSEFTRQIAQRRRHAGPPPLIFGVIQGGGDNDLRRQCAEALLEIGFDGFGFGGWPLDAQNKLLTEILAYVRTVVPVQFPLHALGVGHPHNVVDCARLGYGIFDSAMPTRDARHARLYSFTTPPDAPDGGLNGDWLDFIYIGDEQHIKRAAPLSPYCDGLCCARYSAGYLHHLFKIGDSLFYRLATIHNLRFMAQLMTRLRGAP